LRVQASPRVRESESARVRVFLNRCPLRPWHSEPRSSGLQQAAAVALRATVAMPASNYSSSKQVTTAAASGSQRRPWQSEPRSPLSNYSDSSSNCGRGIESHGRFVSQPHSAAAAEQQQQQQRQQRAAAAKRQQRQLRLIGRRGCVCVRV